MSLAQACAEVGAAIERARSLFAETPRPATAADLAAAHLTDAATFTVTVGHATAESSGGMVNAHRGFVDRAAGILSGAAGSDNRLSAQARAAVEITRSGAVRLAALAQESRATARAAAAVTTPSGQRAILAALKSQVDRTNQVVDDTRRRAGDLATNVGLMDYPLEPPSTPPEPDPTHQPESTLDGIHGTGSKDMPIITAPGDLGPPSTGMYPGGTTYVEAIPGSGVWIPSDQISGKLWMPSHPGELAPWNYEEIAPGVWWPRPPSVDPATDHPSYRSDA